MVSTKESTCFPAPSLYRSSGEVSLFCDQPKVHGRRDREPSSRIYDEGCPNENPSVDDATGYSEEEEEALEEEALSEDEEVVLLGGTAG
jgi:hypothetical protein